MKSFRRETVWMYCLWQTIYNIRWAHLKTFAWESKPEKNHTNFHRVIKVSYTSATCSNINDMSTSTEDRITVLTVGSCLRFTFSWSVMFVFTLMQSHTHVDTVQTVLERVTNSRHICWSHTMKVLGSRVTFVRRKSASVVALGNTFIRRNMGMWVQSIAPVTFRKCATVHVEWPLGGAQCQWEWNKFWSHLH